MLRTAAALMLIAASAALLRYDVHQRHRANVEYPLLFANMVRAAAQGDEYQSTAIARSTLDRARELLTSAPADMRIQFIAATACLQLQRFEEGIRYCDEAVRIDRRPEIYFLRGELELHAGRRDRAIRDFASAAEFTPIYLDRLTDPSLRLEVEQEVRRRGEAVRQKNR